MKRSFDKIIPILIIALILLGCVTYKRKLHTGAGDIELARINAIIDFTNTYKTPKRYLKKRQGKPFDVFLLYRRESFENNNSYIFSIIPEKDSISIRIEHKLGEIPRINFPNNYITKDDKLFLWNDGETPLQNDVIEVMNKFGVLDSMDLKWELGLLPDDFEDTRMITIDDRLEAFSYFICRSDISEFKKVVTWKAFGYYNHPKLNCP